MQRKKNPLIDLERYRVYFFLIGLIISLAAVIGIINIKFYEPTLKPLGTNPVELGVDDAVIPITLREPPQKISRPAVMPEKIEVIDNSLAVENEFEFATTETDEDEAITDKVYQVAAGSKAIERIEQEYEEVEEPLAFAVVESAPIFPGCEGLKNEEAKRACFKKRIISYVQENFYYSGGARLAQISGRIFVQFIIEKDGAVSQVEVVRGLDPALDKEALRVVNSLPKMIPAQQRGRPVRMRFIVPIKLVLQ
jgi:protein TonB